ncbi:MAG: slipin family protein [Armatimonadetes bacterium]|nr:slipin family protein [Armatimonadota bacterium]
MELLAALLLGVVGVALSGLRVCQEYERGVVFRLGRFAGIRGPGLYWLIPLGIETQRKVDMRTNTVNVEPQETITKDSVTIKVNAVLWYKINDPQRAIIKVADYRSAVYQVALTTLRNVIGQHMLDEMLRDRDKINEVILQIVAEATDPWGVAVEMVEMKDVEIPPNMQRAMAKEAEAAREKRARLIKAEAEAEASLKLTVAAKEMGNSPVALELRRMQMLSEVGTEQNTTTIIMIPSEFVNLAQNVSDLISEPSRLTEAIRGAAGDVEVSA